MHTRDTISECAPSHCPPARATLPGWHRLCTLTPCHATPRHATPRHATPRHAMPRHVTPRHASPRLASPRLTPRHARHATNALPRLATQRQPVTRRRSTRHPRRSAAHGRTPPHTLPLHGAAASPPCRCHPVKLPLRCTLGLGTTATRRAARRRLVGQGACRLTSSPETSAKVDKRISQGTRAA